VRNKFAAQKSLNISHLTAIMHLLVSEKSSKLNLSCRGAKAHVIANHIRMAMGGHEVSYYSATHQIYLLASCMCHPEHSLHPIPPVRSADMPLGGFEEKSATRHLQAQWWQGSAVQHSGCFISVSWRTEEGVGTQARCRQRKEA
jgi:hypothetical protein